MATRLSALLLLGLFPASLPALQMEQLLPWLDSISAGELEERLAELDEPGVTDDQGATLLHHALCDAPGHVALLLEQGLDADAADDEGASPLHHLFRCGHAPDRDDVQELPALLLEHGADPDRRDDTESTPLHAALVPMRGGEGPRNLYRDGARRLLEHGADPTLRDRHGRTPLHLAAGEQEGRLVELLLELGADPRLADDEGRSPLWLAATTADNAPSFVLLLDAGADPEHLPGDETSLLPPLLEQEDWRKVDALLRHKPDKELPEDVATDLLARALWQGADEAALERFLDAGARVEALTATEYGDLAWWLARQQRLTLLDRLLDEGLEINQVPASGYAPLVFADAATSRELLARGARPELPGPAGGTALVPPRDPPPRFRPYNALPGRDKVEILLDAGYPPDLADPEGRTALEVAVRHDRLWMLRELLAAGADPRQHSGAEASLLPLALAHERLPLIRTLAGALPDATQLHPELLSRYLAEGGRDRALVEWMLLQGFSLEYRDDDGNTPLLIAASRGEQALVELLLDYGADADAVNYSGCDLACYRREQRDQQAALPELDAMPVAFLTLALAPAVTLYLLLLGVRLYRNRPLAGPTLRLLASQALAVAVIASLFYQCEDCLVEGDAQLAVSAVIALLLFLLSLLPFRGGPENRPTTGAD